MPISYHEKTYKGKTYTYVVWGGFVEGKWKSIHFGKAGVPENEAKALQQEITYLEQLIQKSQDELFLRKNKLLDLQEQFQVETSKETLEKVEVEKEVILEVKQEGIVDEQILSLWKQPVNDSEIKIKAFRLYEQGIPYQETAKNLDLSRKTVMNWYKKFKQIL